ncbi:hypothetical protein BGW38_006226 [Lunasporangiospora selenospora]|uniref:C2H2-type domain-containing protein n=1 Tax=Lunasporangiospora selenospora TaxID=979761 RepID=A0A9P6FM13_9FUNG|nr:hypothetical protein BGW38_006226 [Lunasporangiospora selenospora]
MSSGLKSTKRQKCNDDPPKDVSANFGPLICVLCLSRFGSIKTHRTHYCESHDGSTERLNPLKCDSCEKSYLNRGSLRRHIQECQLSRDIIYPRLCPWCKTPNIIDIKTWSKHSYTCKSWPEVPKTDIIDWTSFDDGLLDCTKHSPSAEFIKKMLVPTSIKLPGRIQTFGFIFESGVKHLQESHGLALIEPLVKQSDSITDDDLKIALSYHKYGNLIKDVDYMLADDTDDFWHLPFKGQSEYISRRLQSCIIQSGKDIILCLKIEVYGRSQGEDPQADSNVALPGSRPFNVVNEQFLDVSQLMIGSIRWNALVTLSTVLTSGTVVVGPHNPFFKPHRHSRLWLKKGADRDLHNNLVRHTRSNFNSIISYGLHAAIHPSFNRSQSRPITLSDLWSFKANTRWSGIKIVAYIFHNLFDASEPLYKSTIQKYLNLLNDRQVKTDDGAEVSGIIGSLIGLVKIMRDSETRPVSLEFDRYLRLLADQAQSEITRLNRSLIMTEVQLTIDRLLRDTK